MASAGEEEDNDAVLSDVEADDPAPISINSPEDVSVERFREVLAELDRERQARESAENTKSELQVSFNRLKALAHEAIKKRDESGRQRDEAVRDKDEALRSNEKLSAELAEACRVKDETLMQRDELAKQFEETVKAKESSRSEIETAAQMLVTGIEKISGKVSNFKNFTAGGLPRSNKYTGLPAVAYGVIKRTNEIVEELLRQIDSTAKSRNEARSQMEQRNYEIAIEVSQLEATISGLRDEVSKKTSVVENLEKSMAEKDEKKADMEKEMSEKLNSVENEVGGLRELVGEYDDKLRNLESKMDSQRPLLVEQLNLVSKIHDQLYDVIKIVDASKMDQSDLSESMFLPQETDIEENIRASLAGMESICELTRMVVEKTKDLVEERSREVKSLSETVSRLVKEKEHIGSLLRGALSRRTSTDLSSKTNELFKVAENGLREAGIDFRFSNHLGGGKDDAPETERDEIYALAGALENIIKQSQLEIIELQHSVEELRVEASLLKVNVEAQAKELSYRKRRVVSEEVERALAKLGPARVNGRTSPKRIEGPDGRNLQLHFRSRLSLPLFTGGKVEGEQGASIHIVLLDVNTGHVVTSGPESSVKLDVVVLEGDFNNEDDEGWTQEEFESHVVKEREGKRPLLTGDVQVTLKEGVGTLGELTFTDNSSWIRSRKFRMGLKVASGFCDSIRIREAKTEAFTVKDHRGELYKKHYPPVLNDEVWRLEKIGKDGSFHKRLNNEGIFTVEEFLRLVVRDSQKLRTILGSGMSNKMWEALIDHAKTCVLTGKFHVYYPDDTRNVGVVFNNIYELSGLISGEQYFSADSLSDNQKVYVDSLVKKAYDNWNHVVEYDGKSLLSFKQNKRVSASRNELPLGPVDYPNALDIQLPQPRLSVSVPPEQSSMDSTLLIGGSGYNDNLATRYPIQTQLINSNSRAQFGSNLYALHDQQTSSSHEIHSNRYDNRVGLALGPPQSSTSLQTSNTSVQQSNLNPFEDWSHNRDKGVDDFLSEEEIRIRSHEMLENEDMQHLLRIFSMGGGGHASVNGPEDGFTFPSYMPSSPPTNFSFEEDRSRSGKAVVGWLKIKAAMRWGFFIRKKAAERRAQIVELDDDE